MRKTDRAYENKNGPNYLIFDDFNEQIQDDNLLKECREEAQTMVQTACKGERLQRNRCDAIVSLTDIM